MAKIRGIAISTKIAMGIANNYMGYFERVFLDFYHRQPLVWLRFIDDIFMIWTHREEKFQDVIEYINSCVETITFPMECSHTKVNVLDTTVKIIVNSMIQIDLYSKLTDSYGYLLYDSAHR